MFKNRPKPVFRFWVFISLTFLVLALKNLVKQEETYVAIVYPTSPSKKPEVKKILFWSTIYGEHENDKIHECAPEIICEVTHNKSILEESHAVVFHGWETDMENRTYKEGMVPQDLPWTRKDSKYWVYMSIEAPIRTRVTFEAYDGLFNWTMTYRSDSDVYLPYGTILKLTPETRLKYKDEISERDREAENDTITKIKLAAWIVTNCDDSQSKRNELVEELGKYIQVDIYGKCGTLQCENVYPQHCQKQIGHMYKFYLAFENSLCQDYASEKFFRVLEANMVPVVYGNANYDLVAPKGSYINYNSFSSAKALAQYLLFLNENQEEYLKYFQWKDEYFLRSGLGSNANLRFRWCRLCVKLFSDNQKKSVGSLKDWLFTNYGRFPVCVDPPSRF